MVPFFTHFFGVIYFCVHDCLVRLFESIWENQDLMGNSQAKKREAEYSGNVDGRNTSTVVSPRSQQQHEVPFNIHHHGNGKKKLSTKEKYALIPDNFTTLQQVSLLLLTFAFVYLFCNFFLCFLCGFCLPIHGYFYG